VGLIYCSKNRKTRQVKISKSLLLVRFKKILIDEWVDTFWNVVNVRPKTLYDYRRQYISHLARMIGFMSLDDVDIVVIQR
jgi:hypothetical protein